MNYRTGEIKTALEPCQRRIYKALSNKNGSCRFFGKVTKKVCQISTGFHLARPIHFDVSEPKINRIEHRELLVFQRFPGVRESFFRKKVLPSHLNVCVCIPISAGSIHIFFTTLKSQIKCTKFRQGFFLRQILFMYLFDAMGNNIFHNIHSTIESKRSKFRGIFE